jgi:hypothetical protein
MLPKKFPSIFVSLILFAAPSWASSNIAPPAECPLTYVTQDCDSDDEEVELRRTDSKHPQCGILLERIVQGFFQGQKLNYADLNHQGMAVEVDLNGSKKPWRIVGSYTITESAWRLDFKNKKNPLICRTKFYPESSECYFAGEPRSRRWIEGRKIKIDERSFIIWRNILDGKEALYDDRVAIIYELK